MSQANPSDQECNLFAQEFIKSGDMTKAFKATFPNSKAKQNSIYVKASNLYKSDKIQLRIRELQTLTKDKHDSEFDLEVGDLKKSLALAIKKGLKDKTDAQGNKVAHNISGAVSAISEINRMNGNHAPVKNVHTGEDGDPIAVAPIDVNEFREARKAMIQDDDC